MEIEDFLSLPRDLPAALLDVRSNELDIHGLVLLVDRNKKRTKMQGAKIFFGARRRPFGGCQIDATPFPCDEGSVCWKLKKPLRANLLEVVGAPGLEPGTR
ncbi:MULTISPECIES: hypothetical protein [Bradyrhizobium]|uniref:hypothetical protein n=1 Tax=Bradyrhizobium TaxID=374 RepID=UPI0013E039D2|nr:MULTISPECIES: hypothetical protein [Bradyrhizobium]